MASSKDLRGKLMARVGITFDHKLAPSLFLATLRLPLHFGPHARQYDPLQDLATIRNFLMGGGPSALLDLPWIPLYFAILYIVHPLLAAMAIGGAVLLVALSVVNQTLTKSASRNAGQSAPSTMSLLMDVRRNSEAAAAMSMGDDLCKRWGAGYVNAMSHARDQADQASLFGAISKALRLVLQSGILALGAYLVIDADMSPGGMMACSIILARALAPIDQVIAYSRGTAAAWQALKRLRTLSAQLCPKPRRSSTACRVPASRFRCATSRSRRPAARRRPWRACPSKSKRATRLASSGRAAAASPRWSARWSAPGRPRAGKSASTSAMISHYSAETLADAIGHLPQSIELFDGTIAENIARFRKNATTEEVIEAAQLAGVHEMILSFPKGYDTPVGEGGMTLSGGQRQRIGLARAVFGEPFLVVLDEPNSNLDPLGEQSLNEAIQRMRPEGPDRGDRRPSAQRHLRGEQDSLPAQWPRGNVRKQEACACGPVPARRPASQAGGSGERRGAAPAPAQSPAADVRRPESDARRGGAM